MIDFLTGTFHLFGDPLTLTFFVFGVLLGAAFGTIPGLSGMTLGAIFLPYTAFMTSSQAIAFYGAVYVSSVYGGAITAILFNIPGCVENAPTTFDGYPMAQKGEASKAIGLSVSSSALGSVFACALLMIAITPIARIAVKIFSSVEIIAVILFAFTICANLGAESYLKGWISVLFGLFLGTIGMDPVGGLPRFAFHSYYVMAGISFTAVVLGFFGVAEVLSKSSAISVGNFKSPKPGVSKATLKELFKHRMTVLRSFLIGTFIGIVPGLGSAFAAFLAYIQETRWAKNPETFGKGDPRGVIAPETANNSASAATMIPFMALGLPGGGYTALMIGVLTVHHLEPGPLLMFQAHDMVWVLFASMFWTSFAILLVSFIESKLIVNLLHIPYPILGTFILVLSTIGAYTIGNGIFDVVIMFAAGILGVFLKKYGYSLPTIIMAIILGQLGEAAFSQAIVLLNYNYFGFFTRPISCIFILGACASTVFSVIYGIKEDRLKGSSGLSVPGG